MLGRPTKVCQRDQAYRYQTLRAVQYLFECGEHSKQQLHQPASATASSLSQGSLQGALSLGSSLSSTSSSSGTCAHPPLLYSCARSLKEVRPFNSVNGAVEGIGVRVLQRAVVVCDGLGFDVWQLGPPVLDGDTLTQSYKGPNDHCMQLKLVNIKLLPVDNARLDQQGDPITTTEELEGQREVLDNTASDTPVSFNRTFTAVSSTVTATSKSLGLVLGRSVDVGANTGGGFCQMGSIGVQLGIKLSVSNSTNESKSVSQAVAGIESASTSFRVGAHEMLTIIRLNETKRTHYRISCQVRLQADIQVTGQLRRKSHGGNFYKHSSSATPWERIAQTVTRKDVTHTFGRGDHPMAHLRLQAEVNQGDHGSSPWTWVKCKEHHQAKGNHDFKVALAYLLDQASWEGTIKGDVIVEETSVVTRAEGSIPAGQGPRQGGGPRAARGPGAAQQQRPGGAPNAGRGGMQQPGAARVQLQQEQQPIRSVQSAPANVQQQ